MIGSVFIVVVILILAFTSMKRPQNFPPGPVCLPFLMNLHNLDYKNIQDGWTYLRKHYGDTAGIIVPKFKLVVVSGWNAITEVLGNEHFQGRPDACLLRDRFEGGRYGLVFTDGKDWRIQRRFTLHHFRNLGFGRRSHESVVLEEVHSLTEEIMKLNSAPFVVEHLVALSALNMTWHVVGGQRFDRADPAVLQLAQDVKEMMHNVTVVGGPAVMFPVLRYLFPKKTGYKSIKNSCAGIIHFIRAEVEKHVQNMSASSQDNFVDIYLQKMRCELSDTQDSSFTMKQLEGICMDLLAAGSDTSAGILSFAFLFLCLKPEIQDRIYAEIEATIGTQRLPTNDDKPSLVYTNAYLCEILRFRCPVPTLPLHRATKHSKLSGYSVPKDALLILNVKSIFTDRRYWGDPENFRPQRFITEDGKVRKEERLIVFGKGKRSCLGETLGRMSTFLILAGLVQRFSFRFPEGEVPRDTEGAPGVTAAPPEFRVIATPRDVTMVKGTARHA